MKGKYSLRSKSLGTRVRKLESKVRAAKPETKVYQDCLSTTPLLPGAFYFHPLNNLGQGTADSQRLGVEYKITGFRLHTQVTNDIMCAMLVQSADGLAPLPSDFLLCQNTQMVASSRHVLRVIKYLYNFAGQNHQVCYHNKRYKKPLTVGFNNTGQVNKNGLWLVFYNPGILSHDLSFTWTMYYTDS